MNDKLKELVNKLNDKVANGTATPVEKQCFYYNQAEGSSNKRDGYDCSICNNKEWVSLPGEDGLEYIHKCSCQKTRRTIDKANRSGLGNILKDKTFDKYEAKEDWQKKVKQTAQDFCNDENANWFYIGGQAGCGKSHLCTAIIRDYIVKGHECRYMMWRDDAVRIKQASNDLQEYQKQIKEFKNCDVLYIDDLFKMKKGEEPTGADVNLAFEILNHRLMQNKVTIISSNFTIREALEIDEATISRIYEMAGKYKITIPKDQKKNYRLRGETVV